MHMTRSQSPNYCDAYIIGDGTLGPPTDPPYMTRSKSPNYCDTYIIGDGTLVEVDEFKLLGVTFSKDLSFDSQIDAISNKVSKLSRFITRCTRGIILLCFA